MAARQPVFSPGKALKLRLDGFPWFIDVEFVRYDGDPAARHPIVIVRDGRDGRLLRDDAPSCHRDGPAFLAWNNAVLRLRVAEGALLEECEHAQIEFPYLPEGLTPAVRGLPTFAAYAPVRATASRAADIAFALHPHGASLAV